MVIADQSGKAAGDLEAAIGPELSSKGLSSSCISDEDLKKLRIQSGVVRRLCKEHSYYISECASLLRRIEDMKVLCVLRSLIHT